MKLQLASLIIVSKNGQPHPLKILVDGDDVDEVVDRLSLGQYSIDLEEGESVEVKQVAYTEVVDE